ncbi:MAG: hypothetical protein H0V19_07740, partial [Euzebyales bacterium]|nr:hypothetical protein [Euzebyales bacterium]
MAELLGLTLVLVAWNNGANLVPAFQRRYVPVNLAATCVLLLAARSADLPWTALGLVPGTAIIGLAWGVAGAAAVVVAYGLVFAAPA